MKNSKFRQFQKYQNIHCIGIGGIGISALARILNKSGYHISGSDQTETKLISKLKSENIKIFKGHQKQNLPVGTDLVIYSTAIPATNQELQEAQKKGLDTLTYPQALGKLTKDYYTIAVSGTHGKTTTTAMISEILITSKLDPTIVLGSTYSNFGGTNYRMGKSKYLLIEACEYKKAFLNYYPDIMIITGVEHDHFDYYKTAKDYQNAYLEALENLKKSGKVIFCADDANLKKLLNKNKQLQTIKYSIKDLKNPQYKKMKLKVLGQHNQSNALAALKLCETLKLNTDMAIKALNKFQGTDRRMEYRGQIGKTGIYEDYAHHPTAIKVTLKALRTHLGANKSILCVYQPHQYSRTKSLLPEFAKSFQDCNQVIIPNIYEARDTEADKKDISTEILVNKINQIHQGHAVNGQGLEKTLKLLKKNYHEYDTIIIMGAGDVTKVAEELIKAAKSAKKA
jgi:UDP-N-acetylmuramate--alanine ligase